MKKYGLRQSTVAVAIILSASSAAAHAALVFENAKPAVTAMPSKDTLSGDASWLGQPLTGFGHDVPLKLAVQRLLPSHVQIEYMPNVDLNQPITWESGDRRTALQAALVMAKLRAEVSEKAVSIARFDYTETAGPTTDADAGKPSDMKIEPASDTAAAAAKSAPAPSETKAQAPVEKTHWHFPAGYPLQTCLSVVLTKLGFSLDWQVEDSAAWTMPDTRSFDGTPRDALKVVRDEIGKYAPIAVRIDGNVVTATRRVTESDTNTSLGPQALPSAGD